MAGASCVLVFGLAVLGESDGGLTVLSCFATLGSFFRLLLESRLSFCLPLLERLVDLTVGFGVSAVAGGVMGSAGLSSATAGGRVGAGAGNGAPWPFNAICCPGGRLLFSPEANKRK